MVVTGAAPQTQTSIDRRSDAIGGDLQTGAGALADVLGKLPSVAVGPQGEISLRGDRNVMIDGKVSGMLQGENRANALQQLSADQFERVEVITNPSAAFDPEGSAGVINLISRKGRGAGASGLAKINLGDRARANTSLSGTFNSGRLALNGDVGLRRNAQKMRIEDQRSDDQGSSSLNRSGGRVVGQVGSAHAGLAYDLGSRARVSLDLRRLETEYIADARRASARGPPGAKRG